MFLQNGFDEFVAKPIDIRQLNLVLNKFIRDKQPPEVIEAARREKDKLRGINVEYTHIDRMLLEAFARDAHRVVNVLEELNQKAGWLENDEDLRKFTVTVHGIKSSLWNVGETVLADSALKLEKGGKEQNVDVIKEFAPQFLNDLQTLIKKIEPKQDEEGTDENINDLYSKLQTIKDMCVEYDRKGILDLITGMTNSSKETRVVLDSIKEYVIHSDFDNAESVVAAHMQIIQELSDLDR